MVTREIVMSDKVAKLFHQQRQHGIKVIPKLAPLYTMAGMAEVDLTAGMEYILLNGGRGGGKSESVAQALILVSRVETTRILCTREIFKSMALSVHPMLVKWIKKMHLQNEFHITKNSIVNIRTGTDFIFMGMEVGASDRTDTMKSLTGVKYVWYEEAQTATMNSLIKLDPTIRIDGRKLIFTMNQKTTNDAVIKYLSVRKNVLRIDINYVDNLFCPKVLIDQADAMKILDPDMWEHIWMGQPLPEDATRIILPYSQLIQCIDLHLRDDLPGLQIDEKYRLKDYKKIGGFDVAEGITNAHDKNALAIRRGPTVVHVEQWQIGQVHQSVDRIDSRNRDVGFSELYFDAVGVGVAAKSEFDRRDKLNKLPYRVYPFKGGTRPYGHDVIFTGEGVNGITNAMMFKNAKAQSWWNLRLRLANSMKLIRGEQIDRKDYFLSFSSDIKDLDSILLELAQATYEEDNSGKIQIDKAPGVKKVEIEGKSKDVRSPNAADSINYCYAGDLDRGLVAHQAESRKAKVYG